MPLHRLGHPSVGGAERERGVGGRRDKVKGEGGKLRSKGNIWVMFDIYTVDLKIEQTMLDTVHIEHYAIWPTNTHTNWHTYSGATSLAECINHAHGDIHWVLIV